MDNRQIRAFVDFLEVAYRLAYDASDVAAFRPVGFCFHGPEGMAATLDAAPRARTPAYVARTTRSAARACSRPPTPPAT